MQDRDSERQEGGSEAMLDWNQMQALIGETKNKNLHVHDMLRQEYLASINRVTGRNVIVYCSGWLQGQGVADVQINDDDKNGFMAVNHGLDKGIGLDLVLHTPGGDTAATESIVDYLRSMFGTNMRAIVPQLAMSAGTMIACACQEILMGKHSSLGPIDPQIRGIPAHGVLEEFKRARKEIKKNSAVTELWRPILAQYHPTLVGECEKAIAWAKEMTRAWLRDGMFCGDDTAEEKVEKIIEELCDLAITKSHRRHLSIERCQEMGLKVVALEDNPPLQDAVLSLHHACMLTFIDTAAYKIIENHKGAAFIKRVDLGTISTRSSSGQAAGQD